MSAAKQSSARTENRLLAALGENERLRLLSESTEIHLKKRTILYYAGDAIKFCYFPLSGMISVLATTESGKSLILGVVGNEGFVSAAALLLPPVAPYEVMAQAETHALRIKAEVLREEFKRGGEFQQLIMNYLHRLISQISQSAVCHRFHTVEQRFACWLLISGDRIQTDEFSLTQECISQMLGVPRTNVTMIATQFQDTGVISYRYGKIKIIDHQKLNRVACECYCVIKQETNSLYR
ncbi:MAG: Crp/Fnr family transcriptional regulator [Acidobacteriota bacterium]|nr:Crp/Fnr family transcriptional regulator [Acidobacteriota bacterium]